MSTYIALSERLTNVVAAFIEPLPQLDVVPPTDGGAVWFVVVGVMLLGVGVAGALGWLLTRALQLRSAIKSQRSFLRQDSNASLRAGPHRVVFGRVEVDPGTDDTCLRVDIVQRVHNMTHKNRSTHMWRETSRSVTARPFHLVREGMAQVYVLPTRDALLVDDLETLFPKGMPLQRVRRADVRAGEEFYVYGDLHGSHHPTTEENPYRGNMGTGFTLRPPRGAVMIFATSALEHRLRGRFRTLWVACAILFAHFVAFHALVSVPFATLAFRGEAATAEVISQSVYLTKTKSGMVAHHFLVARTQDGVKLAGEVPDRTAERIKSARDSQGAVSVPIVYVPGAPALSALGAYAHVSVWTLIFNLLFVAGCLSATSFVYRSTLPWYDKKRLNESGGHGHWSDADDRAVRSGGDPPRR